MTTVVVGGKVQLHGSRRPVTLRALRAAELSGGWSIPVMVDWQALLAADVGEGPCEADVATSTGTVRVRATLDRAADGMLVLRDPGLATAALHDQRRENVRAEVALDLRGTLLRGSYTSVASSDGSLSVATEVRGRTCSVSGGGIAAFVTGPLPTPGSSVYLELELPDGELAPTVVDIVESADGEVRGRFVDISPRDRERLVRLVFARQRADLAARRRQLGPR
ncbi:PilZ domain-containing protein [Spongisporangium articulatum]|uniref:PilZ domain-containing protein n=1 Tax=Spongisporangium articulatum TaxID=3362603 RepID=A0ABW8AT59_9ACTN